MTDEQPAAAAPRPRRCRQALITWLAAATQILAKRLEAQAGKAPPQDNPWQNIDRLQRQWLGGLRAGPDRRAGCGHRPDPAPRVPNAATCWSTTGE
jgi:hypothetical protein